MRKTAVDLLARALAVPGSRRQALIAASAMIFGGVDSVSGRRKRKSDPRESRRKTAFPRKCNRFIITAGPNRNDEFQHTDDDLLIEIIPRNGGAAETVFDDNNNAPNGPNGEHLSVSPFTAKVGDEVHIVARNEVAGGCELDEIWLQCIEGRGGAIKLTDSISPEECRSNANQTGVFFETTVRIKNR